jgi:hypothetical protein
MDKLSSDQTTSILIVKEGDSSTEKLYPRFIDSSPCGEDLFPSGSQKSTAASIANYIKTPGHLRLIGLDGGWGSGKSNAIKILEVELGNNYHFFTYDTWAHQEDLQRRSFLEELTENLQPEQLHNRNKWAENLKSLLSKKKTTEKKTIPKLSPAIITSILIIVLVPVVNSIAEFALKAFWKAVITAIPVIIPILIWIVMSIRKRKLIALVDLFYIYQQKDLEDVTEETISENEPSNKNFRKWMSDLSGDLKKHTIIVLDNMDRLPPDKVKVIWTLIHSFFSTENYRKITVIVPFDRRHIRDVFGGEQDDKEFEKTNQFISKTFPAVFNVSPIVFTDWKDFFEKKYADAFGTTENDEYLITRKVFDLYTLSITPRKIIAFMNDLVAVRRTTQRQIKLRYVALFVLNKEKILENPTFQILNKQFLERSKNLFTTDDDVSDNIAALLFNIPVVKAAQVSLSRHIETAIRQRKVDELKEYAKNSDFISILEQIPTEDIEVDEITFCLNELDESIDPQKKETVQLIWDRVIGKYGSIHLTKIEFTETHKILLSKARPHQSRPLVKHLVSLYYQNLNFNGPDYYYALRDMEQYLRDAEIDVQFESLVNAKKVEPKSFVEYLDAAKDDYERFQISADNTALEQYFLEKIPSDLDSCKGIQFLGREYQFLKIKAWLETAIKSDEINSDNFLKIFNLYKSVQTSMLLPAKLSDAKILQFLDETDEFSDEYYELAAMRIARGSKFTSNSGTAQSILSLDDEKSIGGISNRIQSYSSYGDLLLMVSDWPQPLLKNALARMVRTKAGRAMNIRKVLPHFMEILSKVDVTAEELLDDLNRWNQFLKAELKTENLIETIPDIETYRLMNSVDNEFTRIVWLIGDQYIRKLNEEEWKKSLRENDYATDFLGVVDESNRLSDLPDSLFHAYKYSLKEISISPEEYEISTNELANYWKLIYEKADKIHLQPTLKDIRDTFLKNANISNDQFLFFEKPLREHGGISERSGDFVRHVLKPVMGDNECLKIITASSDFYVDIISGAGNDAFEFIDAFREKIELENSTNSHLSEFGKKIDKNLSEQIRIEYAKYFSPEKSEDEAIEVTDTLRRIVEKELTPHFKIDNGIVNEEDPHSGVVKRLLVKYTYKGELKERTFEEHKWLRLP